MALLYRYADFVTLLGGTEFHLGWIVGVGMIGSLLMRLALGTYIDRYGTKFIWLGCTLLFVAVCFAHLAVASHTGVAIYLLRILFCCAVAGIFGSSMTFISTRGPSERMGELVGMLGTAGFLGIVAGTLLGDYLLGSVKVDHAQVAWMFVAAGLLGVLSFPFAWLAAWSESRPRTVAAQSLWSLLRRHRPGTVLVVGVAMGLGLGLPQTFLRTYAAQLRHPADRPVLPGLLCGGHHHAGRHPPLARTVRHAADHFARAGRHRGEPGVVPAGPGRMAAGRAGR